LGNLSNLWWLSLSNNQLSGSIPAQFGEMSNLEWLFLSNNQLSGSIPAELGSLSKLSSLGISNNQLSGSIPPELGNLGGLEYLYLDNNQLSGDVPDELTNLIFLWDNSGLNLDYNRLNVPDGYPVQGNALHEFLSQKDPDWHLRQPVETAVTPQDGGTIISRDGAVQVEVPQGAAQDTVTFTFIPQAQPSQSSGLVFANQSFQLIAEDSSGSRVRVFNQPLKVTIKYNEDSLGDVSEDALRLFYWDEGSLAWKDAATTCTPESLYERDLANNTFAVNICHLTEFGVFVSPQVNPVKVYLPLVRR